MSLGVVAICQSWDGFLPRYPVTPGCCSSRPPMLELGLRGPSSYSVASNLPNGWLVARNGPEEFFFKSLIVKGWLRWVTPQGVVRRFRGLLKPQALDVEFRLDSPSLAVPALEQFEFSCFLVACELSDVGSICKNDETGKLLLRGIPIQSLQGGLTGIFSLGCFSQL